MLRWLVLVGLIPLTARGDPLGPLPHRLVPGASLTLPSTARRPAADARLTFGRRLIPPTLRTDVALDPNQTLETGPGGAAEVTRSDGARLRLGERTRLAQRAARKRTPAATTLEHGTVWLQVGAAPVTLALAGGGAVVVTAGEATVAVDDDGRTRLAVGRGAARLRAAGQEVLVGGGYGVRVGRSQPPAPPHALPAAPSWAAPPPSVILASGPSGEVRGEYRGEAPPAAWHVQLARDDAFHDLIADTRPAAQVTTLAARDLGAGAYCARVSASDADGLEGPFSAVARVRVAPLRIVDDGEGRSRIELPSGLYCALDDAPLAEVTAPLPVSRRGPHALRCAAAPDAEPATLAIAPPPRPLVEHQLGAVRVAPDGGGERELMVRVTDEQGAPLRDADVRASAGAGAAVGPMRAADDGTYTTTVHWAPDLKQVVVQLAVNQRERYAVAFDAQTAQPPSLVPVVSELVHAPRPYYAQLGVSGGLLIGDGNPGVGPNLSIDAGVLIVGPHGQASVALRLGWEQFTMHGQTLEDTHDVLSIGVPITYYWLGPERRWSPFLGVEPRVFNAWERLQADIGDAHSSHFNVAIGGFVGILARLGPGSVSLEGGYRYAAALHRLLGPDLEMARGFILVGYRVWL